MRTVANGYDGGIVRFLPVGRPIWLLVFGLFVFVSGQVFVHRVVIGWQGTRLNWVVAAIVNLAFGLVGVWSIYVEMVGQLRADRNAGGRCVACGYGLRGNASGACLECGTVTPVGLCESCLRRGTGTRPASGPAKQLGPADARLKAL
jgi:hypothetical protein